MANGFSGVVRLSNVDDFISPAQNCIIPLMNRLKPELTTNGDAGDSPASSRKRPAVTIETETIYASTKSPSVAPPPIATPPPPTLAEAVKISLNDCLACSGCITSAESVLVEQQSYKAFRTILDAKSKHLVVVVSVSPQSLASLAAHFHLSLVDARRRLCSFLSSRGVDHVFDTTIGRTAALLATQAELARSVRDRDTGGDSDAPSLPILSSACPGWICYVEKTYKALLPHVSRVRSPMSMMAAIVKSKYGKDAYHCSIMPCYDKKLEASRSQLTAEGSIPETDCVVGTAELIDWMDEEEVDFVNLPSSSSTESEIRLTSHDGGTGGGYAWHAILYAKEQLHKDVETVIREKRINKDMTEWSLERCVDNQSIFKVARAYGFRNIQNVVLKMKRDLKATQYSYIEMMACPSGCINGGGQIKPSDAADRKAHLSTVQSVYDSLPVQPISVDHAPPLVVDWLGDDWLTNERTHTTYRAMEANDLANALNW